MLKRIEGLVERAEKANEEIERRSAEISAMEEGLLRRMPGRERETG